MTCDPINHPSHYVSHPSGIECIQITEWMDFLLGNAIKYMFRSPYKGNAIEDLKKAIWYINREIAHRKSERWAEYPSDIRYEISTAGNVKRKGKNNRKLIALKNGYLTFLTSSPYKCHYVHRAVVETFYGGIPKGICVCHVNGDKQDNHITNLRISTQVDNMHDRRFHGTHYVGGNNPAARLNEETVLKIRLLKNKMPETKVANIYGVSRATIGRIWRNESWSDSRPDVLKALDSFVEAEGNKNISKAAHLVGYSKWSPSGVQDLEKAQWYLNRAIEKEKR